MEKRRNDFELPDLVRRLVESRNQLRERYRESGLSFTLDGNLVGDLGEAVAAELFGLSLHGRSREAIDGTDATGRTVQVKATGTRRGPAFRNTVMNAEYLLFLEFEFESEKPGGRIVYNGPEEPIRKFLMRNGPWTGQRMMSRSQIEKLDRDVLPADRLPRCL